MTRTHRTIALIAAALVFAACDARSAEFGLHTFSVHAPQRGQNNDNFGGFVIVDGWRAGAYRNSYDRTTVYGARVFNLMQGQYGTLDLSVGGATGYRRICNTYTVQTGIVEAKAKHKTAQVTTTTPVFETRQSCQGFSRHEVTPMAALTYSAPVSFLGATPEVSYIPGIKSHSSLIHASFKWSIR
jgi:hypothetical protein